jgi:hypothetical protein
MNKYLLTYLKGSAYTFCGGCSYIGFCFAMARLTRKKHQGSNLENGWFFASHLGVIPVIAGTLPVSLPYLIYTRKR